MVVTSEEFRAWENWARFSITGIVFCLEGRLSSDLVDRVSMLHLSVTVKKQQSPKPLLRMGLRTYHITVPGHICNCKISTSSRVHIFVAAALTAV
jgi:hypothetical protein